MLQRGAALLQAHNIFVGLAATATLFLFAPDINLALNIRQLLLEHVQFYLKSDDWIDRIGR